MGKYRDKLEIVADVLAVAIKRAKKTQIMYQANLSYKLLSRYLDTVVDAGLVRFDGEGCYTVTSKGEEFLEKYLEYCNHCESLEDQSNRVNREKIKLEEMCLT